MTTATEYRIPHFSRGDRIRKAVEDSGMTAQQVAAYLGVSRNALSAWMHDRNAPRLSDLRVLSQLLNVPVWWLQGEDSGPSGPVDSRARNARRKAPRKWFAAPYAVAAA